MKALVVEDDKKVARLLERMLNEEGYAVDKCDGAADALRHAMGVDYTLIVLDWMLFEGDGVSACRELRRAGVTAPVLMLTARGEVGERVLGLEAGADDYLVKPFHVEEFLARVRALERRASSAFAALRAGALVVDRVGHAASIAGRALDLTAREYALLVHLAMRVEKIVTRSELLTQVWDSRLDPGSNLVDVQVSRLRDKLGEHHWMIETVRGQGYRLRTAPSP